MNGRRQAASAGLKAANSGLVQLQRRAGLFNYGVSARKGGPIAYHPIFMCAT